jgi:hypothetical protein
LRIAIRFPGPSGPVVFDCERKDYPASFEVPPIIRKHARRLGVQPGGPLEPVAFLHYEVARADELLAVDAGLAPVVCAKIGTGDRPAPAAGGTILGLPHLPPGT